MMMITIIADFAYCSAVTTEGSTMNFKRLLICLGLPIAYWCTPSTVGAAPLPDPTPVPLPAQAAPPPVNDTPTCRIGAYLISMHDLDTVNDSFQADLWLWSVCPQGDRDPLEFLEFSNANEAETSLYSTTQTGDTSWGGIRLTGTFRAGWDGRAFPFDKHRLTVSLEETVDISKSRYVPDNVNSNYGPNAVPAGWRVTAFQLVQEPNTYQTTFGDPTLEPDQGSTYDRLQVQIDLVRVEYGSFVKLTGPVYVAFVITLVIFILVLTSAEVLLGRLGLLGAVLFAVVVSMQQASAEIGASSSIGLVDMIHIVEMIFTLIMIALTVVTWMATNGGRETVRATKRERRWVVATTVVYIVCNAGLIMYFAWSS